MTDQKIQIAIAEACGWEFHPECGPLYSPWWHRDTRQRASNEGLRIYTEDRNAMHDALSTLTEDQWYQFYYEVLPGVVRPGGSCQSLQLFRATIKQLDEAFLRTIGKWTE